MDDNNLNLFKLQYHWPEGEFWSTILATPKTQEEIEKDLKEIVESLRIENKDKDHKPHAYYLIQEKLAEKDYFECSFVGSPMYEVDDGVWGGDTPSTYIINHKIESSEWKKL